MYSEELQRKLKVETKELNLRTKAKGLIGKLGLRLSR